MQLLLIDGVSYTPWIPPKEEVLENMVEEHANAIFGEYSIYFNIKKKLTTPAGIVSIPDGYVIEFGDIPRWYIVEVELSSHSIFGHVVPQISKFSNAINDSNNQRVIVNALYRVIQDDAIMKARISSMIGQREIHEFLYSLVANQPILVIVIEQKIKELDDICTSLSLQSKVVELKTFTREGIGLAVHAHLFEPIHRPPPPGTEGQYEWPEPEWSEQDIIDFWGSLSEGVQEAFRIIAKQPGGRPKDDILEELEIDAHKLAGRMASASKALHHFEGKPHPVVFDKKTRKYRMIPELSRAITKKSL